MSAFGHLLSIEYQLYDTLSQLKSWTKRKDFQIKDVPKTPIA